MRLAIIRQRYNPYGGAERFIERAAAALAGRLSLTVYAREWKGSGTARVVLCAPFFVGRLWRDASFSSRVCRMLAPENFDLVQSHERLGCCDIYRAGDGVHAAWLERRGRGLGRLRRLAMYLNPYHRYVMAAERRVFEGARLKAVICNSRMVRDEIGLRFAIDADKLHVIYNGVDLQDFHPRQRALHRASRRRALTIPEDACVFLFVGSGFERKGVPVLIRAFARLSDQRSRLVVVGKDRAAGQMLALARRLGIADRVHFAGAQAETQSWYGIADVFVLPTLYDPFPNAALEALACGLPVVTTRSSGVAEFIQSGVNGEICEDALCVDELAHCMDSIISRAAGMSQAARETAERLGIDAMANQLVGLYRKLLPGETI